MNIANLGLQRQIDSVRRQLAQQQNIVAAAKVWNDARIKLQSTSMTTADFDAYRAARIALVEAVEAA